MSTTAMGLDAVHEETFGFDLGDDAQAEAEERVDQAYQEGSRYVVTPEGTEPDTKDYYGQAFDRGSVDEEKRQEEAERKAKLPREGEYQVSGLGLEWRSNRYEGQPELAVVASLTDEQGRSARVVFTLEPVKRMMESGKAAFPYVLFKQARSAFEYVNGRLPENGSEFEAFLANAPFKLRVGHEQSGKGLRVWQITGIKG